MDNLRTGFGCICVGAMGILILLMEVKLVGLILPGNEFINTILIVIVILLNIMALNGDPKKGE